MSHPIKFRAYVPELRKMVDVFAVNPMNQTIYLSHVHLFGTEGDDVLVKYGDEPDEVKLMQYTGRDDKHGLEIFEGDILADYERNGWGRDANAKHSHLYAVERDDTGMTGFTPFSQQVLDCGDPYYDWQLDMTRIYVVGNIHENPELPKATTGPRMLTAQQTERIAEFKSAHQDILRSRHAEVTRLGIRAAKARRGKTS